MLKLYLPYPLLTKEGNLKSPSSSRERKFY